MTVLTPGCDPDMSVSGAPFGAAPGPRLRSGAVLLALTALCAYLVMGDAAPGVVAVPAAVVGLCSASALVMRGVRLTQHRGTAAAAAVARAAHRGSPVPAAP
ncbi:hypothetical protein [Blastococcus haudaquaticus]|uniref:Uncharacterized protein n=1 Tax=Blastococcus haudaquaticus TaxID=1938745 RepID=A0A286GTY3_9ACTN|nr:hypothetical protein [Blastococcus haudaquaticus]SOD98922.1 hypothetical protein SAMN06272739_2090 [Blastococcus haudaquaticus]